MPGRLPCAGQARQPDNALPDALLQSARNRPTSAPGHDVGSISRRGQTISSAFLTEPSWLPAFSPGIPSVAEFPFERWARLLAAEWQNPGSGALGGHPGGHWPLRECIAEYVATARGIPCDADQVIMVTGNREGTELASRVLLDPGDRAVIEDPGYPGIRAALLASGARVVPLRVDKEGLVLSEVGPDHEGARMMLTAPSHQYPLGNATSLAQRMELIAWAYQRRCWIVEDDYDSEYRYSGRPCPSLYSLDPDGVVIYTGTFSKTMSPALRLGYLIVPPQAITCWPVIAPTSAKAGKRQAQPLLPGG